MITGYVAFARVLVGCAVAAGLAVPLAASASGLQMDDSALSAEELLGKKLFFDTSLSHPGGQSCASCHDPSVAFTDPDKSSPTSNGVNPTLFGNRNTPSAKYMAFSPVFHLDPDEGIYVGGQFDDGRAATLEDQAKAPFLNPVEMANPDRASVVQSLASGPNADLFKSVYGNNVFDSVDTAYNRIAQAIAAYERTPELSPFTSKYDFYLAGRAELSAAELRGLDIFNDPAKGNCAACHPSTPLPNGTGPLFTDFTYDNIGVPKNVHSGFLTDPEEFNPDGVAFIDLGLGKTTGDPELNGAFKVTTLRNIAVTDPYTHNGYFKTLDEIVDFYATRDSKATCLDPATSAADAETQNCWPVSEVPETVNHDELGNLPLSADDKADLVVFLKTLTDGYDVPEPGTMALFGLGLASLLRRRRQR